MGPHPAVAEVRRAVRAVLDGPRVLVACSGGPDSVALADAVAFEAGRAGVAAGLVTVDHGLQPGSAERAREVAQFGRRLDFYPVEILPVTVGTGGGPEGAARTARYAALDDIAERLQATVLLGHTLDDQAETVLLALGRGSGPTALAGMPAAAGRYRRPLLGVRRATTVAACAALGRAVWDDPHNADRAFTRARLRHDVLPALEAALQGGVAGALARTAQLLRDDLTALDAWAATVAFSPAVVDSDGANVTTAGEKTTPVGTAGGTVAVADLAGLPRAVRTRVLRRWAAAAGAGPLSAERTGALDALVTAWHGQGPVQLPGRIEVRRESGTLIASPPDTPQETRVDE